MVREKHRKLSKTAVESLAVMLRIREIRGSVLGTETDYADRDFCDFRQCSQENAGRATQYRPRPLPSKCTLYKHTCG